LVARDPDPPEGHPPLRIAVLLVLCMSGKARAEGEVSVGAYLSLTGASATFGVSTQRGIHLAVEQYNAKAKV
jgi:branched-chain amino acid transport system substrate-binding protein